MPLLQPGSRSPEWQARQARQSAGDVSGVIEFVTEQVAVVTEAADNATTAATNAQAAATGVSSQVTAVTLSQQVRDSYPDPGKLSAITTSGVSRINIAAHVRHYLHKPETPACAAGQVTGLVPARTYHVFYDDPATTGGAVAYKAATAIEGAISSLDNPGRHYVGEVTTPAAGATATSGSGGAGLPYWKQPNDGLN